MSYPCHIGVIAAVYDDIPAVVVGSAPEEGRINESASTRVELSDEAILSPAIEGCLVGPRCGWKRNGRKRGTSRDIGIAGTADRDAITVIEAITP